MYNKTIPLAAAFSIFSGAAHADAFTDQIVADLQAQGYGYIEVKDSPNYVEVEAVRGVEKLEVVYDRSTGEIIEQEEETADQDEQGQSGVDVKSVSDDDIVDERDDDDDRDDDRDEDRDDDDDDDNDDDNDDDDDRDDDRDDDDDDDDDD